MNNENLAPRSRQQKIYIRVIYNVSSPLNWNSNQEIVCGKMGEHAKVCCSLGILRSIVAIFICMCMYMHVCTFVLQYVFALAIVFGNFYWLIVHMYSMYVFRCICKYLYMPIYVYSLYCTNIWCFMRTSAVFSLNHRSLCLSVPLFVCLFFIFSWKKVNYVYAI